MLLEDLDLHGVQDVHNLRPHFVPFSYGLHHHKVPWGEETQRAESKELLGVQYRQTRQTLASSFAVYSGLLSRQTGLSDQSVILYAPPERNNSLLAHSHTHTQPSTLHFRCRTLNYMLTTYAHLGAISYKQLVKMVSWKIRILNEHFERFASEGEYALEGDRSAE